jgi:ABC-type glycerol-3-phosphate transport system permease component
MLDSKRALAASGEARLSARPAARAGLLVGGRSIVSLASGLALALGGIAMVLPFIWMVLSSFKRYEQVVAYPPVWIPDPWVTQNFVKVWTQVNLGRCYANSLFVSTCATTLVLFTSALLGYILAKFHFRGRDVIFISLLATMMIPWPLLLLPQYQVCIWLRLMNTHWALILPGAFSAYGIFLMRQYMLSVPSELIDAARIDGASEWRIFFQIVAPLAGPALAALAIFTFMWNWDSFIWPLVVISSKHLYTLPLALAIAMQQWWTDYGMVMAGATIAVVPIMAVYLFFQRWFVAGITLTGMKG